VAAGIFWRHKGPLTKFCQRAIFPRMIHNVASDEAAPFSRNLFSRWMIATIGDPVWASFLKEAGHPKRSVVFCTVVLMASADFWKSASQTKEIYSAMKSNNPIRSMHSDIVVIEASVFFLYNFVDFVLSAIKNGELVEADKDASISALVLMCHIIQATTDSAVSELLTSRLSEYNERHSHEYAKAASSAAHATSTIDTPEAFEALTRRVVENGKIGISAPALARLYGDELPAIGDGKLGDLPGVREQYEWALRSGRDIEVPIAEWMARTTPEIKEEVREGLRWRGGGMTLEESKRPALPERVGLFVGVLLRSVEKRTIHDPLLGLDPRPSLDLRKGMRDNAVWASTTIYMTTMLPAFFETYKNVVHNYPMD
jgi:hypothetical protein